MKGVLLFFLMIVAAVFLGLVIAYWYLRRLDDNSGRVLKAPRSVPFPAKHPPVDLTPTSSDWLQHRPAPAPADKAPRQQPQALGSNPDLDRDDLKRITGIGPKLERLLNANGIVSFRQIAEWQDADIQAMDKLLPAFHGRIRRDDWIEQARRLRDTKESASETPST